MIAVAARCLRDSLKGFIFLVMTSLRQAFALLPANLMPAGLLLRVHAR